MNATQNVFLQRLMGLEGNGRNRKKVKTKEEKCVNCVEAKKMEQKAVTNTLRGS